MLNFNGKLFKYILFFSLPLISGVLLVIYASLEIELFVVTSESMHPEIKKETLVIVMKQGDYFEGEVVTYGLNNDEKFVTHRIVEIRDDLGEYYYITKGVNNSFEDNIDIRKENIIGRVILKIPYFGSLFNPIFFGLIVYLPFGVFFGFLLAELLLK